MDSTFSGPQIFGVPGALVYVSIETANFFHKFKTALSICLNSLLHLLHNPTLATRYLHKKPTRLFSKTVPYSHYHQIAVGALFRNEHIWTFVKRQTKAGASKQSLFHLVYVAQGSPPSSIPIPSEFCRSVLFCVNPLRPPWPLGDLTLTLRHIELEIITPIWEKNTLASRAYQALFFLTAKKTSVYWKQFSQLINILMQVLYLIKVKFIETVSQKHFSWPIILPTSEAYLFPLSPCLLKGENGWHWLCLMGKWPFLQRIWISIFNLNLHITFICLSSSHKRKILW